ERGNWQPVLQFEQMLRDYVLWPDLEASYFRSRLRIADHAQVGAFLDQHGTLKPARELRYQFSLHLADAGHLSEYLDIYRQYYQGLNIAKLDCLALQAEIREGRQNRIISRGLDLWLVGESQADECDPVFAHLRAASALTDDHYEKRFALAVDERHFSLARFLSRPLSTGYLEQANSWLMAQNHSLEFLRGHADRVDNGVGRQQMIYAIERIAFSDPLLASENWIALRKKYRFTAGQQHFISRHIALWAARRQLPEASAMLYSLPPAALDAEVGRWMIRTSLRRQDWANVLRAIALLPEDEQGAEEWQYWEAVALKYAGEEEPATAKLNKLATTRSYYGFLAADALGNDYAFADSRLITDDKVAARLAEMPALIRARELFHVGLEGRGRSEWDAAVRILTPHEQAQAAILAHQWGWHSRAIATASMVGEFDDLMIRYPLPWREDFAQYSQDANINDSWAYGIARSESLFMRDIRSAAGAIGIMQILPETGKRMAREIRFPYSGLATLTDSASNIRLGTMYLRKMFDRFDENKVLATAAYNAGPLNVEAWLPGASQLDARIWIENIPYNETRAYVRRVLTADAIFHWRLTGKTRRLSTELPAINPPAEAVAGID
ncbi:MAG: transglycosylase SLT domain-containing protein, partial [Proteobacteria bacterium]|nr:transglycosylase SLT domain-containing protein [Pseudomonadota bacterium]